MGTTSRRPAAEGILGRDLYGGVTAVRDMADDIRAGSARAGADGASADTSAFSRLASETSRPRDFAFHL